MNDETMKQTLDAALESRKTRRSFLTKTAGAAAVALPALTLGAARQAMAGKPSKTKTPPAPTKLTGLAAILINEVMNDEAQHVPIIQNLLNDSGNPLPVPIRKAPNFNVARLIQPNLQTFLETASVFENTGSGLYHGALLNIQQTQEYFPTAAGLASVESRHAAWINSLLGEALVPDFAPVEAPIDQSLTLSRVAEFVTDPRSTFPSFDTTVVSDANNFFILDFVLFLEYIESTFYALNVPRFT
jgi:hypothetical protein